MILNDLQSSLNVANFGVNLMMLGVRAERNNNIKNALIGNDTSNSIINSIKLFISEILGKIKK